MPRNNPREVKDLLERPIVVAFATSNPDGQPQVTPVWRAWKAIRFGSTQRSGGARIATYAPIPK